MRNLVLALGLFLAVSSHAMPDFRCPTWLSSGLTYVFGGKAGRVQVLLLRGSLDRDRVVAGFRGLTREEARPLYSLLATSGLRSPADARVAAVVFSTVPDCPEKRALATRLLELALAQADAKKRDPATILFASLGAQALQAVGAFSGTPFADEARQERLFFLAMEAVVRTGPLDSYEALDALGDRTARLRHLRSAVALFRYLVDPDRPFLNEVETDGVAPSLLFLSSSGRFELLNRVGRVCDPISFAGIVFDQVIAETDLHAWEIEVELFTQVMEAISRNETHRRPFAASPPFARIRRMHFELRSSRVREFHSMIDHIYARGGDGEPPYRGRYNAQLERLRKAQELILKP